MRESICIRRSLVLLLAVSLVAAVVGLGTIEYGVKKVHRTSVSSSLTSGAAPALTRTSESRLLHAALVRQLDAHISIGLASHVRASDTRRRAPDSLDRASFGSRPPPALVRVAHFGGPLL